MSDHDIQKVFATDDDALAFTQGIRKQIVEKLMPNGQVVEDEDKLKLLLQTVDGIDRSALGNKKIKVEEAGAANQAQAASIIAKLLNNVGSAKPFEVVEGEVIASTPALPDDVVTAVPVLGEMDINPPQLNYDAFVAQFGDEPPALPAV